MAMENEFNEFESAIPGQSLAGEQPMGSVPWETPADFPDPDEFYMYIQDKLLNDDSNLMNVVKLLEMGITVDAIVDGILMNSFMMGQISADVGVVLKEPIVDVVLLIAQEADVIPARRDDGEAMQQQVRIEEVLATLAEEDPNAVMGEEEAMPDMMEEPSGMRAPPDDMEAMMAMEDMPEVDEEEEDPLMIG